MDPSLHCRWDRQGSYWIEPGGVVGFEWIDSNRTVVSRRTSSVVDIAEPGAPEPWRVLSLFTYWRTGSPLRWLAHRQGEVVVAPETPESYLARVTTDIVIMLDRDPLALEPGERASMEVMLSYEVESLDGGPTLAGEEVFLFDAELDDTRGYPGWPGLVTLRWLPV